MPLAHRTVLTSNIESVATWRWTPSSVSRLMGYDVDAECVIVMLKTFASVFKTMFRYDLIDIGDSFTKFPSTHRINA